MFSFFPSCSFHTMQNHELSPPRNPDPPISILYILLLISVFSTVFKVLHFSAAHIETLFFKVPLSRFCRGSRCKGTKKPLPLCHGRSLWQHCGARVSSDGRVSRPPRAAEPQGPNSAGPFPFREKGPTLFFCPRFTFFAAAPCGRSAPRRWPRPSRVKHSAAPAARFSAPRTPPAAPARTL